jgi:hypothetical protein
MDNIIGSIEAMMLERDLISPEKWQQLYNEMPNECREIVDNHSFDDGPIGIGRNEIYGWFILASGQGPFLVWKEK